jgi:RNA polymerase sigma factor (sigma-70 family)
MGPAAAAVLQVLRSAATADGGGLSDRELLRRFAEGNDQAAFAALVRRHAAMVLGACRRALPNLHDAEDACQATFLVLARKAACNRWQPSVANWLFATARNVARNARLAERRRNRREARAAVPEAVQPVDRMTGRELLAALDEELEKLPPRYREPLVLCYLEGLTRDEAAARLGAPAGTLKTRLERGRKRLGDALTKRGCALGAGLLALAATSPAGASPPRLVAAVLAAAAGPPPAVVAALAKGAAVRGLLNKPLLAALTLLGAGLLGALAWSMSLTAASPPADKPTPPPEKKERTQKTAGRRPDPAGEPAEVRGRVLDPEGNPVAGARVSYLQSRPLHDQTSFSPAPFAGAADADGRFRLAVTIRGRTPFRPFNPIGTLIATAPRYAPAAIHVGAPEELKDFTLRLVKDDVPVEGRIIDLEGKPVAGVTVRPVFVRANLGGDLGPWFDAIRDKRDPPHEAHLGIHFTAAQAGLTRTAVTDADGRFRLSGAGRERIVALRLDGPAVESQFLNVMTRPGKRFRVGSERHWHRADGPDLIYPARFEHAVAPASPVEGVARDHDTGKPLAGVTISSRLSTPYDWPAERVTATTDADGRYRLVGRPRLSPYWVLAKPPAGQPYVTVMRFPDRPAPRQSARLDFNLKRGALVRGRVTERATGRPVQAEVRYFALGNNPALADVDKYLEATTLSSRTDGSFTLVALPGPGIVTARLDDFRRGWYVLGRGADRIKGYDPKTEGFQSKPEFVWARNYEALAGVEPGPDATAITCDLQIDPGKTVSGACVGPDGKPLAGAHIHASLGYGPTIDIHDLPTPRFTLYAFNPEHPRPFFFHHHGKKLGAAVVLKGDEPEGLTVRLQPTATVTGRLLDTDGTPLPGAQIAGEIKGGQLGIPQGWGGFFWGQTDRAGRFRIEEIIPGLRVGAHHHRNSGRRGDQLFDTLTLKPGEVRDLGDIKVKAGPN